MPRTNTLAYFNTSSMTSKKKFNNIGSLVLINPNIFLILKKKHNKL